MQLKLNESPIPDCTQLEDSLTSFEVGAAAATLEYVHLPISEQQTVFNV